MGMMFSAPQVQKPPEQVPGVDPEVLAMREAEKAKVSSENAAVGEKARRAYAGKTMGQVGSNALYSGGAAGFGRTLGGANLAGG